MRISGYMKASEPIKDGSVHSNDGKNSDLSAVLIDTKDEALNTEQHGKSLVKNSEIAQRKSNIVYMCCHMIIAILVITFIILSMSQCERKTITSVYKGSDLKQFQENLNSGESVKIVQEHIFCMSCHSIVGNEQMFFETSETDRCCLKDIESLLQLMRSAHEKSAQEYSTEINVLKSSIDDVRENTDILTKEIFSGNKSNDTDTSDREIPTDSIMWSMVQKNNRLLNLILNRRRSILYMIGTAFENSIYWTVEVGAGYLSFEDNAIHVKSGGQYMINSKIHFSKELCNGTETIGYTINQEYHQEDYLTIARARTHCETGSSIDEDLRIETVLQVGLGQRLKLHLQYDKNLQSLISKTYRGHHIMIYEL